MAGVTTLGVAESCIHCAHISRSRYLNTVSACVLYMMLKDSYQEYLEHLPPASQPIHIDKWCEDQKSPMFRVYYFLFKLKLLVLQFVRSVRSGNIDIYLASITNITYYFLAVNHYNYARWAPVHIRDVLTLPETHPELNKDFEEGRFTVNKTGKLFSNIGLDHGLEQNIKDFKHHGGPLSLTHSPDQLLLYLISGPEVTNHVGFFKDLISDIHNDGICHHEQTYAYQNMFINHTKLLYAKCQEYGNVFSDNSHTLYDLSTGIVRPSSTIDSILSLESIGRNQYEPYVHKRLVDITVGIEPPIVANKLELMKLPKKNKSKNQEVRDLKDLAATLSQLYVANQARGGDTTEFFSHENVPIPPSISKDGHLYHGTKSDLLQELIDTTNLSTSNDIPEVDAVVIDGPAVAHMIVPKNDSIIDEYYEVYLNHMKGYFNKCKRVDVIFDIYVPFSLKQTTRETRGVAPSMIVRGSTKVKHWTRFLKNDSNKESLFEYLATSAIQTYISEDHQLVITYRDGVISNPESVFINENLSPCDHEEADTRMIFHM